MAKNSPPLHVIVDTNVLVALYNTKDSQHKKALKVFDTLSDLKARLVVSNYILLEIYTILSQRAGKKQALEFGGLVRKKKPFIVKRIAKAADEGTWRIFEKVRNKNISFVDCSIMFLALEGNYEIVTFDEKIVKLQKQFGFSLRQ